MATALRVLKRSNQFLFKNNLCLYKNVRLAHDEKGPWNYLWQPGPYPRTEEERMKAAEKYGMHPKEYQPYPEDEGFGDYPKLPDIGADVRDPYYPWDYPSLRRNFNEPIHRYVDLMGEDRYAFGAKHFISPGKAVFRCVMMFIGMHVLFYLLEPYPLFAPVLEKQVPKAGVVHYTFEPVK